MEVSKRLVVRGFVQGVGYRAFVKQVAYRLEIKGTVQNLRDGGVEIYARAETEAIDRFKEFLLSQSPGEVEDIEEYPEGTEGYGKGPEEWIGFNILRDDYSSLEETMEYVVLGGVRLEKGMKAGFADLKGEMNAGFSELKKEMNAGFSDLGSKVDTGFSDLGSKVDTGFSDLGSKVDTGFSDLGNKVDTGFSDLGSKVDAGFSDLGNKVDTGFFDIKNEIKLTRDELGEKINASNEKTEDFHLEMVQKFDALDVKYGIIGQGLNEMNGRFERLEGDVREMKDAFLKLVNHMTEE